MSSDISSKHKLAEEDLSSDEEKRIKVARVTYDNNEECEIFRLTRDAVLHVISYLSTDDAASFGSTCHRFNDIVESGYKFKSVYMICDGFHRPHKYYLNFLNGTTERIKIRCTNKNFNESTTHEKCMNKIVFRNLLGLTKNLKTLEIINHNIESKIKHLPSTLQVLRLEGVTVTNKISSCFFCNVTEHLPDLSTVELSHADWLEPHQLMPLAKLRTLRVLKLTNCPKLRELIPYAAVACSQGFLNLEVIDFRFSPVCDTDIVCFNKIRTLKELYLQMPEDLPLHQRIRISDYALMTFNEYFLPRSRPDYLHITPFNLTNGLNNILEKLVVRNYPTISDRLLRFTMTNFKVLKYLDISGSKCTMSLIELYKKERPEVTLIHDNLKS